MEGSFFARSSKTDEYGRLREHWNRNAAQRSSDLQLSAFFPKPASLLTTDTGQLADRLVGPLAQRLTRNEVGTTLSD
jgi:hypothetical protein